MSCIIALLATPDTTQVAPLTFWEDGSIRIGSSRVTLDCIVHEFASGSTGEQIQDDFPTLSLREIYGAVSYYLDHEHQVEDYLQRRDQEAARIRAEIEDRPRIAALARRLRERKGQANSTITTRLHLQTRPYYALVLAP